MATWDDLIPPEEREVYRRAGYGRPRGFGRRPALLIVDVEYNLTGHQPEPILDSIARYPNSCGLDAWAAIPHIRRLLDLARERGLPVVYTHGPNRVENGPNGQRPRRGNQVVDELTPLPGEIDIAKVAASAFGGTRLVAELIARQVDTVIVTGCTTSGCVRATVVDAYDLRFKVIVPEECVFDRASVPHRVNLFDMAMKYADVVPLATVQDYLVSLGGPA